MFNYWLDIFIDEQSPDEDEEQARRFLAQPVAKNDCSGKFPKLLVLTQLQLILKGMTLMSLLSTGTAIML